MAAIISTSVPRDKYARDYIEALEQFDKEDFETCLEIAKLNLTDPTLSRYWTIKNLLLVASVEDDWIEAEVCIARSLQVIVLIIHSAASPIRRAGVDYSRPPNRQIGARRHRVS